jgi:hypothetical protein
MAPNFTPGAIMSFHISAILEELNGSLADISRRSAGGFCIFKFRHGRRVLSGALGTIFLFACPVGIFAADGAGNAQNVSEKIDSAPKKREGAARNQWVPASFDSELNALPPNYRGVDAQKFYSFLSEKIANLKKGEFETTEEFRSRTSDVDEMLSPISAAALYAFRVNEVAIKYDADAKAYVIGQKYGYSCRSTYSIGGGDGWLTCKVVATRRKNEKRVGVNGFGVAFPVWSIRGHDFALAVNRANPLFGRVFLKEGSQYLLSDNLPLPVSKAKELKGKTVGVLFVGRVAQASFVSGRAKLKDATPDSPSDIFIEEDGVPFDLQMIVYYVVESGEILGRRNVEAQASQGL